MLVFVKFYNDYGNIISMKTRELCFLQQSSQIFGICSIVGGHFYGSNYEGLNNECVRALYRDKWLALRSICDDQCFLGFENLCHKFMKNYSEIVLLLTQLTMKN